MQKPVDDRGKIEHRPLDRATGNSGLIGRSCREQCLTGCNGTAGFASRRILDAALLARLHHRHQFIQRIEAAREADIGVELHQDFLGLADRQAGVQALVQGSVEPWHVTGRHERCDQWNGLLPGRQRLCRRLCAGHGLRCLGVLSGHTRHQAKAQTQGYQRGEGTGLAMCNRCISGHRESSIHCSSLPGRRCSIEVDLQQTATSPARAIDLRTAHPRLFPPK
ncbi:hypothetical protein D9M71_534980 [compost metagenome]